ncbi:MAG TPA: pyridoxamine 5'-phosphate oxidase family protein [Acidimicrobiia bacterium]|jgi:nitroimidazol reductase NimA-like FMN-containing flavoprotein (pyridoxamine 5'-phosphate oxidase superfamily)|nr:pyridoxamine 5'-phosphate oxidase family protein [Acidimicrobiia bacterium]
MQELTETEARDLMERAEVAHLGVIADGEPYVTAVSFVISGNLFLFRTGPGRRLKAIESGSPVCVEVSEYDSETGDWASVVAVGPGSVIADAALESGTVDALYAKYRKVIESSLTLETAVGSVAVAVMMGRISGRSSGKAWAPRTRPGRL